jgi:hypothetical protein
MSLPPDWIPVAAGDFLRGFGPELLFEHDNGADSTDPMNRRLYIADLNGDDNAGSGLVDERLAPNWRYAATGDFNGSGASEILLRYEDAANAADPLNGDVYLWTLDGLVVDPSASGTISSQRRDLNWRIVGVGDFNGDGKSDVLWQYEDSGDDRDRLNGDLYIWEMNGERVVTEGLTTQEPGSRNWRVAGVADFSGDGRSDVLMRYDDVDNVADPLNGRLVLYEQNGLVSTVVPLSQQVGLEWQVADVTKDNAGAAILFRNVSSPDAPAAATYEWLMKGAKVANEGFTCRQAYDASWRIVNPVKSG